MKHGTSWMHFRSFVSSYPTGQLLILIQGVSLLLWWVVGAYLGLDQFASRSFWGADGHCDPITQGLGMHCWGDYYYPVWVSGALNPFDGTIHNPYPGAALLPFMFFSFISKITGVASLGVITYLVTMFLLILWSIWFGTRGIQLEKRLVLFAALSLLAPPVLVTLDRGNSVGFLVPLLVWLLYSLRQDKPVATVFSIALLSVIKPHFGLLALLILVIGRRKEGLFAALVGIILNLIPYFIFWQNSFPHTIPQSLFGVLSFQDWSSVSQLFPTNLSFAHGFYLGMASLLSVLQVTDGSLLAFVESSQSLIGFCVLAFAFLLILIFLSRITIVQAFVIAISAISLTSSTTYAYYTLFAIPALIGISLDGRENEAKNVKGGIVKPQSRVTFILWLASMFTMIQFPIFGLDDGTRILTTNSLVGLIWMFAYLTTFIILLAEKLVPSKLSDRGLT